MDNNKKMTGYPHIDKQWLSQYGDIEKYKNIPQLNIYDFMKYNNVGNEDSIATDFYGQKKRYGQMFEDIEDLSKGLVSIDVARGDRVLALLPTVSTTANFLYGISNIGAVSDFYDPRPDSITAKVNGKKIIDIIKNEKIKHIVCFAPSYELFFSEVEDELKELGINDIVIVSIDDAMNLRGKTGFILDELDKDGFNKNGLRLLKNKMAQMKKDEEHINEVLKKSKLNIIKYKDLINNSRFSRVEKSEFKPDELATIVHTSGTSGAMPKPIPLTNENLNYHAQQIIATGEKYLTSDSVFHLLPYFASFGVGDVAHYGFCCGSTMIQIPEFTPQDLPRKIYRTKPNMLILAPTMLSPLMDTKYLEGKDLSFLKRITVGGGDFPRQREMRAFLDSHNAKDCRLEYGYGMSQTGGSATIAYKKDDAFGTIGKPLPFTNIAIVNPQTLAPIKFNKDDEFITGEAMIGGPSVTSGIIDGKVIEPTYEIDGEKFIKSGDLIDMYRNGTIKFNTRLDRTFMRFDGYKYKSYIIEDYILKDPRVQECLITPYYDEDKKGNMPIANIVLDKDYTEDEKMEIINSILYDRLINDPHISTRQIPTKVRFLDEMPLTKNAKANYKLLEKLAIDGSEFNIDIEETNLSVSNVEVTRPHNSIKSMIKK